MNEHHFKLLGSLVFAFINVTFFLTENERDIVYIHTNLETTDEDLLERMEGIQKTIARYLMMKQENVQLYGLKKGSLIFIFSLPKRVLETRSLLDPSLLESMKKHKVFKLEPQDAVTITGNIFFIK